MQWRSGGLHVCFLKMPKSRYGRGSADTERAAELLLPTQAGRGRMAKLARRVPAVPKVIGPFAPKGEAHRLGSARCFPVSYGLEQAGMHADCRCACRSARPLFGGDYPFRRALGPKPSFRAKRNAGPRIPGRKKLRCVARREMLGSSPSMTASCGRTVLRPSSKGGPFRARNRESTMSEAVLGIIGGSGIYDLPGISDLREERIDSPWGEPSDALRIGRIGKTKIVFLPRHGRGHAIPPSEINYRANIDVLKRAGVTDLVSLSACGSYRAELYPGLFVLVDQFVGRTSRRESSFFGKGCVAHVSVAHPVGPALQSRIAAAAEAEELPFVRGGTLVTMEGPQF